MPMSVKSKGFSKCPNPECGSDELLYDDFQSDLGEAWQTITCQECGRSWQDVYVFHCTQDTNSCITLDENGKAWKKYVRTMDRIPPNATCKNCTQNAKCHIFASDINDSSVPCRAWTGNKK